MRVDSVAVGIVASVLLFFPIGIADALIAFNNPIGNWAVSSLVLPYAIFFGLAGVLKWRDHIELAKGFAVGGALVATLIVVGVLFLALMFRAATEFG